MTSQGKSSSTNRRQMILGLAFMAMAVLATSGPTAAAADRGPPFPCYAKTKRVYYFYENLEKLFKFAAAVQVERFLYVAGVLPWNSAGQVLSPGNMTAQTAIVYRDLTTILAANGATWDDVIEERVDTSNMAEYLEKGVPVRDGFVGAGTFAATLVEVKANVFPGVLIEVGLKAYIPCKDGPKD